jgi:hypothetical protein
VGVECQPVRRVGLLSDIRLLKELTIDIAFFVVKLEVFFVGALVERTGNYDR